MAEVNTRHTRFGDGCCPIALEHAAVISAQDETGLAIGRVACVEAVIDVIVMAFAKFTRLTLTRTTVCLPGLPCIRLCLMAANPQQSPALSARSSKKNVYEVNAKLFKTLERTFQDATPANYEKFQSDTRKLAKYLSDSRGYYESARPEVRVRV